MPELWCAGATWTAVAGAKKMGAVKGACLDYASSFDPLQPAVNFVGCCGMILGA